MFRFEVYLPTCKGREIVRRTFQNYTTTNFGQGFCRLGASVLMVGCALDGITTRALAANCANQLTFIFQGCEVFFRSREVVSFQESTYTPRRLAFGHARGLDSRLPGGGLFNANFTTSPWEPNSI